MIKKPKVNMIRKPKEIFKPKLKMIKKPKSSTFFEFF